MTSRLYFVLANDSFRAKAKAAIDSAPKESRVEIKAPKRTIPQNDRMWAMLTDIAEQLEHGGRRYDPDEWKFIFLHAFGKETRFLPALDGKSFVPIPQSSSDLSVAEMGEFMEFVAAEGAMRGVEFTESERETGRAA